jgi:O-antigen/teichoic acid export membrane protein
MWKIYKNTGFMIWSGGISLVNSLLVWAIIARYLGQTAFGHFTLIMALYLVGFNICSLGLHGLLVREVTGRRTDKDPFIASVALVLGLANALWAGGLIATGLLMNVEREAIWPLAILSFSLLPSGWIYECEALLLASERAWMIAAVNTGENLLKAVIPLSLISLGFGLTAVCATFTVLRLGALTAYLLDVRRRRLPLARPTRACVREVIRYTPTFLLINFLAGLHGQVGTLLLTRLQDTTDVAVYGAASRLMAPWILLCASFTASVNPTMCRMASQSVRQLGRFCQHSMSNLLAILLPLAAGTYLVAPQAIQLIFGSGYDGTVAPLRVLIWSLLPLGMTTLMATSLTATNNQRIDAAGNALAVAANVGLNLALIPRYGALGVAIAQLASMSLLFLFEFIYVSWTLYRVRLFSLMRRFLIATATMVVVVRYLNIQHVWMIVPIGVLSYFGCLVALGWRPVLKEVHG